MTTSFRSTFRAALQALTLSTAWLAACQPAWAQGDFASVRTGATTHGLNGQGPFIDVPGAATQLSRGLTSETSGPVVVTAPSSGGVSSTVSLFATATAPSAIDQLASVGASARVDAVRSARLIAPFYQWTDAVASASFVDYLQLGALPSLNQLVLSFQLSGGFNQVVPSQYYPISSPGSASVTLNVDLAAGVLSQNSNGLSFGASTSGSTRETTTLDYSRKITTQLTSTSSTPRGYTGVATAPGVYQITLGPDFFAAPGTSDLRVAFSLSSFVSLYAYSDFAADPISIEADFSHTLRMTGLSALDAQGNDITDQVVLGFASLAAAVPEPQPLALLLAGLGVVGWAARRHATRSRD